MGDDAEEEEGLFEDQDDEDEDDLSEDRDDEDESEDEVSWPFISSNKLTCLAFYF